MTNVLKICQSNNLTYTLMIYKWLGKTVYSWHFFAAFWIFKNYFIGLYRLASCSSYSNGLAQSVYTYVSIKIYKKKDKCFTFRMLSWTSAGMRYLCIWQIKKSQWMLMLIEMENSEDHKSLHAMIINSKLDQDFNYVKPQTG